jgi:hypothetical protein
MKKNKIMLGAKENMEIANQKKYQRKIKTQPVEQQTLHKEAKKPAQFSSKPCPTLQGFTHIKETLRNGK